MRLVKTKTTKLKPGETAKLLDLVNSAIKRDDTFFSGCEAIRKFLSGEKVFQSAKHSKKETRIAINLMHAHVRSIVPTLFFRDPFIEAQAVNPTQESSAVVWQGVINHVLERTNYKRETKAVVRDSVVYPEGWKKWFFHKAVDKDENQTSDDIAFSSGDNFSAQGEENKVGPVTWHSMDTPVGVRISPTQMILDSSIRQLDQSRFVAVRYKKLLSELVADDRYPVVNKEFKERRKTQHSGAIGKTRFHKFEDSTFSNESHDDDDDVVTIYEVWAYQLVDFKLYKQVIVLMDGFNDEPIRDITSWEEYAGKFLHTYPFTKIELNPVPDELAVSELGVWQSLQDAVNWLMSRLVSMVENQKQYFNFYPDNAKNAQQALRQLNSGKIREFISAKESGQPVVEPVQMHQAPKDDYSLLQTIQSFIQQVGGIGQNRRGGSGVRTAKEAAIIEGASQIKDDEKIDIVADFIMDDMNILVRMLRESMQTGFVFKIQNDVGTADWAEFTQFDADWSPDIRIRPHSFKARLNQQRVQSLLQLFNSGLQLFPIYGKRIALDRIFRNLADELEIPNVSEILTPQIDARIKQMMEIIQMMQGVESPVLGDDDHDTESTVLADFMSTDLFTNLAANIQDIIARHKQFHDEGLQENQKIATGVGPVGNQFDDLQQTGGQGPTPGQGGGQSEPQGDQFPISGGAPS